MTGNARTDHDLLAWLAAHERPARYLDQVMTEVAATRQRSRRGNWWRLPEVEPFRNRSIALPIAASLLLAALLGALIVAGAILRERPPLTLEPPTMAAFLIAERSNSAWVGVPLEVEAQVERSVGGRGEVRFFADGSGRYRVERESSVEDITYVDLVGDGYWYTAETWSDGTTNWWDASEDMRQPYPRQPYPLSAPYPCSGGWAYVDTVLVIGRVTDHLRCDAPWQGDGYLAPEAWIDRETFLVLRTNGGSEWDGWDGPREVVEIRVHQPPAGLFELPPGAQPMTRP